MEPIGLYIHIPFCLSKCPYCDFYSLKYEEDTAQKYIESVIRALENPKINGRNLNSIYFGGGTPVLLGEKLLDILQAVRKNFSVQSDCEITLEANPAAMGLSTLQKLHDGGFNRISIGVQSASDGELARLGRRHNFSQAIESVQMSQQAGFQNVSVDLMLGTPNQTKESITSFIETFSELSVQHISGYLLKIEQGTPFAKQHIERICPDEDSSVEMYLHTVEQMKKHGFQQYEISNFAKPGFESRHNLKYWHCEEYIGIGPAAHSFLGGKRFYFPRNLQAFVENEDPWSLVYEDGEGGDVFEYAMLRLRLTEGISLADLKQRFAVDTEPVKNKAEFLQKHGLLQFDGDRIVLTPKGFLVSNSIIVDLLEYC